MDRHHNLRRSRASRISGCGLVAVAMVIASSLGCRADTTVKRYRMTGTVTFDGRPVAAGELLFTPDGSRGNTGPQGVAEIRNGRYDTRGTRAPGVAGGPTVVRVTAVLDDGGTKLVKHEQAVDLPREDADVAIDIPATAKILAVRPET